MKITLALVTILLYLSAIVAAGYGWCMNIYKLVTHVGPWAAIEIARAVGVVMAPLGIVMGYIG